VNQDNLLLSPEIGLFFSAALCFL